MTMISATLAALLASTPTTEPTYEPGTAFIYSRGRVETVVENREEEVVWATRRGREYVRNKNIVLPITHWTIDDRVGERRFYGENDAFWPPEPGARTRFRVVTDVDRDGEISRSVQYWNCQVREAEPVALPNGEFDALPIQCERFSANTMNFLERRTWWWSEEIGHYVQREYTDLRDAETSRIRLCAVLPPRQASEARIEALAEEGC